MQRLVYLPLGHLIVEHHRWISINIPPAEQVARLRLYPEYRRSFDVTIRTDLSELLTGRDQHGNTIYVRLHLFSGGFTAEGEFVRFLTSSEAIQYKLRRV